MNLKKSITSMAVAGFLVTSPLLMLNAATAATPTPAKTTAEHNERAGHEKRLEQKDKEWTRHTTSEITTPTESKAIIKTLDEAHKGLSEVHASRMAIFDGDTDTAVKLATEAEKNFVLAEKSIDAYKVDTKSQTEDSEAYIPFDMTIGLSENFVETEENSQPLWQAGKYLERGHKKEAMKVMHLASIDFIVHAGLIPAKASLTHIKDAIKLLGEKKYHEANLALKAIEDSVVIESYIADAVPHQGNKG